MVKDNTRVKKSDVDDRRRQIKAPRQYDLARA